jgi:glycosyltransferase involved in cell wall biosynthesis
VAPGYYPRVGGEENLIRAWARGQARAGHEVVVATPGDGGREVIDGVEVLRQRSLFRVATAEITPSLPFRLLGIGADIVHSHYPMPWNADWGVLIGRARRLPVVMTYCNDLAGRGATRALASAYNASVLRLDLRLADRVIAISEGYAQASKHLRGVADKTVVIEPGVDTDRYRPGAGPRAAAEILFVGELSEHHRYKGLEPLVRALALIRQDHPAAVLSVAGGGPDDHVFGKLVRQLGLSDSVRFLGFVDDDTLLERYRTCTVFAMPSLSRVQEGFGLVAVEAMASGAPTVVSNIVGAIGPIRERDAAAVVQPGDVQGLADTISRLLRDAAERQGLGERGRALAEERYSEVASAARTLEVYEQLLAAPRAAGEAGRA